MSVRNWQGHDDVSPVIGLARHIEDDSSLSLLMTCLLRLEVLNVLDYKLALKYSVEERDETLLGVFCAEDALESPIDTGIYIFRHINELWCGFHTIVNFDCKSSEKILESQENEEIIWKIAVNIGGISIICGVYSEGW